MEQGKRKDRKHIRLEDSFDLTRGAQLCLRDSCAYVLMVKDELGAYDGNT
jgi:hypothetical protein